MIQTKPLLTSKGWSERYNMHPVIAKFPKLISVEDVR